MIAIGLAPEHATLRADSPQQFAPYVDSSKRIVQLQSVFATNPFLLPLSLMIPASAAPGPCTVLVRTIVSYCS